MRTRQRPQDYYRGYPMVESDLIKELSFATLAIAVLALVLAVVFSSPDELPLTVKPAAATTAHRIGLTGVTLSGRPRRPRCPSRRARSDTWMGPATSRTTAHPTITRAAPYRPSAISRSSICQRCGQQINPERLEEFPYVAYCIDCLTVLDRELALRPRF